MISTPKAVTCSSICPINDGPSVYLKPGIFSIPRVSTTWPSKAALSAKSSADLPPAILSKRVSIVCLPPSKNCPSLKIAGTARTSRSSAISWNMDPSIMVWFTFGFKIAMIFRAWTTSGQLWQESETIVSKSLASIDSILFLVASSTFGSIPPAWSIARAKEANSWPSGTPAKTILPWSKSPFISNEGV